MDPRFHLTQEPQNSPVTWIVCVKTDGKAPSLIIKHKKKKWNEEQDLSECIFTHIKWQEHVIGSGVCIGMGINGYCFEGR